MFTQPATARRMTVLLVEDEPRQRAGLARLVAAMPEFSIVGECADGHAAVHAIRERTPELVLLDVQLPGMSGLDVVRVVGAEHMPAVVFVTAYDRYAVAAFDAHAVDYVMKPFSERRLADAMHRAFDQAEARRLGDVARRLMAVLESTKEPTDSPPDRIVVRRVGRTDLVAIDDIVRIDAADYCVTLHTRGGPLVHRESMTALEKRLPARRFVRVHRSSIVNVACITRVTVLRGGEHEITLTDGGRIRVSRQRWGAVAKLLQR